MTLSCSPRSARHSSAQAIDRRCAQALPFGCCGGAAANDAFAGNASGSRPTKPSQVTRSGRSYFVASRIASSAICRIAGAPTPRDKCATNAFSYIYIYICSYSYNYSYNYSYIYKYNYSHNYSYSYDNNNNSNNDINIYNYVNIYIYTYIRINICIYSFGYNCIYGWKGNRRGCECN